MANSYPNMIARRLGHPVSNFASITPHAKRAPASAGLQRVLIRAFWRITLGDVGKVIAAFVHDEAGAIGAEKQFGGQGVSRDRQLCSAILSSQK